MKKLFLLISMLLCCRAWGATYYMRADGTAANKGDATGCSAASTAMSIATHDGETFADGDIIYLCDDGGVFRDQMDIPSSGTSAGITYQNAPGDLPVIAGSDILNNSTYKWTESSAKSGEYYCEIAAGGDPSLTEVEAAWKDGTALAMGTVGALADGEWDWGNNDALGYNTLYVRDDTDGDPDTWSVDLEAGQRATCIKLNGDDYIILDGLEIRHSNDQSFNGCVLLQLASNCTVRNCMIHNCTYSGVFIYDSDGTGASSNSITNNTIRDMWGPVTGGSSFAIPVRVNADSNTVGNNIISNASGDDGHVCVFVYGSGQTASSNIIENNDITGTCGNGIYVREIGGVDADSNIIRYNNIHDLTDVSGAAMCIQIRGGPDSTQVYYNIIDECSPGIQTDGDSGSSNDDNLIYNNTCYNSTASYKCISIRSTNTGCLVKNNIASCSSGIAFDVADSSTGGTTSDYNIWYNTSGTMIEWGASTYTQAQFGTYQTATSQDANSYSVDPLFNNPGTYFLPKRTSQAIDNGTNVSLTADYTGGVVPRGSAQDIGSYEYVPNAIIDTLKAVLSGIGINL